MKRDQPTTINDLVFCNINSNLRIKNSEKVKRRNKLPTKK